MYITEGSNDKTEEGGGKVKKNVLLAIVIT
jgi:hypothetical protein